MNERIVDLGSGMFGVLTEPEGARADLCVVLINSGNIHRTGPFRLHVRLARELAGRGHAVLRFDVPGVGDSLRRSDRPQHEVLLAMLDRFAKDARFGRFVTGGICAGADSSWLLALDDARIVGTFLLDGIARQGRAYRSARLRRALGKSPREWFATLKRQIGARSAAAMTAEDLREWPRPGEERVQIETLLRRGVEIFALYTGGASYFLSADQFAETFGASARDERVRFRYWPDCDHVFYLEPDRVRLIAEIGEWIDARVAV